MPRSFLCLRWYCGVTAVWLSIMAVSPGRARTRNICFRDPPIPADIAADAAEEDPPPAMFPHPETDRWWIFGSSQLDFAVASSFSLSLPGSE